MNATLCSVCGGQLSPKFCKARSIDIPLRCPHAADPVEHQAWAAPVYGHTDGKEYVAVQKPVTIPLFDDGSETPTEKNTGKPFIHRVKKTPLVRRGTELDLEATLLRPRVAPKPKPHLHVTCKTCCFESVMEV